MSAPRPTRPDPMVHEPTTHWVLALAFGVLLFAALMVVFIDVALMASGR